tara:strand:+ start:98 stop:1312 length:1215 start_codon:yes stop_codon:yes gene_type:complete
MKKTPLKQADATLVQGAYNAAAAGIPRDGQDGMAKGMDKLMEISNKFVDDIATARAEKQKEGDDLSRSILDAGGSLGTSWLTACQGEVQGMHKDYAKAAAFGKKDKTAKGMQNLNNLSAEIAAIKDLNTDMATWQDQKDWSGSVTPKEQGIFNAFMNNDSKKRIVKDENGNRTFEVETPEGWMTTKDIERMANEHKKDYTTMVDIRKQATDIVDKAKDDAIRNKEEGYTGGGYDQTKAIAKMDNTLRNGNIKSLMHDDVLENGKPFVDAIKESQDLVGLSYESLGINPNLGSQQGATRAGKEALIGKKTIDLDGDGKISESELTLLSDADRNLILDAMTNPENPNYNEERTRAEMAKYFVGFINQNYENEYSANGGKYYSDAALQYGEDDQTQADNFMKEQGII